MGPHTPFIFTAILAPTFCFENAPAIAQSLPCQLGETQKLTWEPVVNPGSSTGYRVWVDLDGDVAVIGTSKLPSPTFGRAYIAEFGKGWNITATLYGADSMANDQFGYAVAVSGSTVVIGAPTDDHPPGTDTGSVYVFTKTESNWIQTAMLTANDAQSIDLFGSAVALEGNVLLIGAPGDDDQGNLSGSVYVFGFNGSAWTQQQKLLPPPGFANHQFGSCLALDGTNAVIGTNIFGPGTGEAHVFSFDGASWSSAQVLVPAGVQNADRFGSAVAIDGDWLAAGAPGTDVPGVSTDSGAAYTYFFDGASWTMQQKLQQPVYPGNNENFGASVAMQGDVLIVGCPADLVYYYPQDPPFSGYGQQAGSAYQYKQNGQEWAFQHQLRAKDKYDSSFEVTINHLDHLGGSAAIDDGVVLLSASDDQVNDTCTTNRLGAAYVFDATPADCDGNGAPDTCDPDCNNNLVADACDITSGISSDCNGNGVPDECESPVHYQLDDGTASAIWGAGFCNSFDFMVLNQFRVLPGREYITHIAVPWSAGAPANWPATLLIYNDPNNDGDPNDAVLLASASASNLDEFFVTMNPIFSIHPVPRTYVGHVGQSFFVGVITSCPNNTWVAYGDDGGPQGRSWTVTTPLGAADISAIGSNGQTANLSLTSWMVRALALDCNGNGVWDQCDLENGTSIDINKDGIPDECQPVCGAADIDNSGIVNSGDLLAVINGWGPCPAPPQACAADVTGDGMVNTADLLQVIAVWGPCI